MSRSVHGSALAAVLVVIVLVLLTPAAGANTSAIQFGRIQYDSVGSDTGSNASLNGEYFVVRNYGGTTRNLKGFTVRDAQSHVYTFSTTFNLGSNQAVRVHTGKGTNTTADRYWGRGTYVWNNGGDSATLENASGLKLDSCGWTTAGPGYRICPT